MSASAATAGRTVAAPLPARRGTWKAFVGLLEHDVTVLSANLRGFLISTTIQPLLLLVVMTFIFPRIAMPVGGAGMAATFSTVFMAGLVAQAILNQAVFMVGLPMVREFGVTDEFSDRVMAPTPVATVALAKIAFGALQGLLAAVIVFPLAVLVPATPVLVDPSWPVLAVVVPLACVTGAAFGVLIGTVVEFRSVPLVSSLVYMPLSFFGAVFFTWPSLESIPVLQYAVLLNPLVYMSEGFRAGLVSSIEHMPLPAVYAVLSACAVGCTLLAVSTFKRRVLS